MATKLNFNVPLKDLAGNPWPLFDGKEQTVATHLAPALSSHNQGDPLKFVEWAETLFNGGELSLDESDYNVLKEFVRTSLALQNIIKAPALRVILNAR